MTTTPWQLARLTSLVLLVAMVSGCSVGQQKAPAVIGPSEFGLSIVAAASPDQLPRDGASQSVVVLTVRDDQSRPVAGQQLSLSLASGTVPGVVLSEAQVVTGADGRASFAVIAPPQGAVGSNQIVVGFTPVGTNFANAATRSVTIALTGASNTTAPSPAFTVSPTAPEIRQVVTFDASTTTDEKAACNDLCTYAWDFGDGGTAAGRVVLNAFSRVGNYTVALTVTDPAGTVASTRQVVTVTAPAAPTVTLVVVPSPPLTNQQATFTAAATAGKGHSIVSYDWNFGDGTTASTVVQTVTKTFTTSLALAVTVVVTDDLGQKGTASLQVTPVTNPAAPVVKITVSPSGTTVRGTVLNFDGIDSTVGSGASITDYTWNFGDGPGDSPLTVPRTTHTFTAAGTYTVRLTVRDSLGRTATATIQVTVT